MATLRELLIERFSEEIKMLEQFNLALTKASIQLQKNITDGQFAEVRQVVNTVSVGPASVTVNVSMKDVLVNILANLNVKIKPFLSDVLSVLKEIKDCIQERKANKGNGALGVAAAIASIITLLMDLYFRRRFFKRALRPNKTNQTKQQSKNSKTGTPNKKPKRTLRERFKSFKKTASDFLKRQSKNLGPLIRKWGARLLALSGIKIIIRGIMIVGAAAIAFFAGLTSVGWLVVAAVVAVVGALYFFRDKIKDFFAQFDTLGDAIKGLASKLLSLVPLQAISNPARAYYEYLRGKKKRKEAEGEQMSGVNDNAALTAFNLKPDDSLMLDNFLANPKGPVVPNPFRFHQLSNNSSRHVNNSPQFNTEVNVTAAPSQSPEAVGRGIGKGIQKSVEASDIYYALAEPKMG